MNHLIVYAKRPMPGYAKTRLAAGIGAEEAAGVYARLLYGYLHDLCRAEWAETRITLAVSAPADVPFFVAAFPEFDVQPQVAGDLGTRIADSFARAFAAGAKRVVLTGSDIPALDAGLVQRAFSALETAAVVTGPAVDGGYYLIGQRAPGAALFEGIAWSTSAVLAQTEARARAAGLSIAYLPVLADLDTIEDYRAWYHTLTAQ